MDDPKYRIARLSARVAVLSTICQWQSEWMAAVLKLQGTNVRSAQLSAFRRQLSDLRERSEKVTFPEQGPEWSDLWAAEIQEAFDEEISRVLALLDPPMD